MDNTAMFKATLLMKPHAMQRPRMTRKGHVYSPSALYASEMAMELLAQGFQDWANRHQTAPLEVKIGFVLKKPKTTKFDMPTAKAHGDVDNHIKTVLDALNHFVPDEHVVRVTGYKQWGSQNQIVIEVDAWGKLTEGSKKDTVRPNRQGKPNEGSDEG